MKVTCLTESISRLGGGLFDAERRLQQTTVGLGSNLETTVIGMRDEHSDSDRERWAPLAAESVMTAGFPRSWGYSKDFLVRLNDTKPDIVYSIGLWKYFSRACLTWHQRTGQPYIIAPHGMLDEWAMKNHRIRKQVLLTLYQRKHLEKAACIRALNASEAASIRDLGLTNPICIIPNGVDMPTGLSTDSKVDDGVNSLLFLGRIHPKKGLQVLLKAWEKASGASSGWRLRIAGWGDRAHVSQLSAQIDELDLSESVESVGPLFGTDKATAFGEAQAFILPSFSEGMPMTILEAWSYGLPVVMTPQCNIPAGSLHDACLMCQPELDSVAVALTRLFELSPKDRARMGGNGRSLVEQKFTWPIVARQMLDVYDWVSGQADPPATVQFD